MTQANEQLARELLQSQKTTLATCLASRHVVSLRIFPGYVGDWMPADDLRRKDAIMERFELDRQSFQPFLEGHSGYLSIIVPDLDLADQAAESEG
ncbi:hypothetical protein PENSUB_6906 [Penicillium subrubescens]|uniref:Uncharacterized protein n=1 Tax=Penicillium subrubescens TaxID=1316194 RepID=A0A1Q5TSJ5_9EURO|nr:hypothetical protein PENSUB_6906 [Penicillium subrubescens]